MSDASSSTEQIFVDIFQNNTWKSSESVSGAGSELVNTRHLIRELPVLLRDYRVTSMLDSPCGDFNWMQHVNLQGIDYTGADIVPSLIEANQRFAQPGRRFICRDILKDPLPKVDLILCRDCLFHFSHADVFRALRQFVASGSHWLLTTTFVFQSYPRNANIPTGSWTPLNLQLAPYFLPPARQLLVEGNVSESIHYGAGEVVPQMDRCLGLWLLQDVRDALRRVGQL